MASRRTFSSEFKARVVREALKEQETTSELARRFEVAPSQIIQWKKEALSQLESLFGSKHSGEESAAKDEHIRVLEQKVGQLTIERDFLERACDKLGVLKKSRSRPYQ